MLEVSCAVVESQLDIDFTEIYEKSDLSKIKLIRELSNQAQGSDDLHFPTQYSQPFITQCKACFWKQHWSYWRHPEYNAIRLFMSTVFGVIFGSIFWGQGQKIEKEQDLLNLQGAMYASILFLGGTSVGAVQSVVAVERTVFYRERSAGMYSALPYAFAQVTESNGTCKLIESNVPESTARPQNFLGTVGSNIEQTVCIIKANKGSSREPVNSLVINGKDKSSDKNKDSNDVKFDEDVHPTQSIYLGSDRLYNRYWLFMGPCNDYYPGHKRIYFESSEDGQWEVIDTAESLCMMLSALDCRGSREAYLLSSLEKLEAPLHQAMSWSGMRQLLHSRKLYNNCKIG